MTMWKHQSLPTHEHWIYTVPGKQDCMSGQYFLLRSMTEWVLIRNTDPLVRFSDIESAKLYVEALAALEH